MLIITCHYQRVTDVTNTSQLREGLVMAPPLFHKFHVKISHSKRTGPKSSKSPSNVATSRAVRSALVAEGAMDVVLSGAVIRPCPVDVISDRDSRNVRDHDAYGISLEVVDQSIRAEHGSPEYFCSQTSSMFCSGVA